MPTVALLRSLRCKPELGWMVKRGERRRGLAHNPEKVKVAPDIVKTLQMLTGASAKDCRVAYAEAEGDIKRAQSALQVKSEVAYATAPKYNCWNGIVATAIAEDRKRAAMVLLSCETAFASRSSLLRRAAKSILTDMLAHAAEADEAHTRAHLAAKAQHIAKSLREAVQIPKYALLTADDDDTILYRHVMDAVEPGLGKTGVLLSLQCANSSDPRFQTFAQKLSRHVAARSPAYIDSESEPTSDRHLTTAKRLKSHNGPLLDQHINQFPHPSRSIADYIAELQAQLRTPIAIRTFLRYSLSDLTGLPQAHRPPKKLQHTK